MGKDAKSAIHILQDESPAFLALLDSDPESAKEQLADYLVRLHKTRETVLPGEFISEVYKRLTGRDFEKLRNYTPAHGRPFWYFVWCFTKNLVREKLRAEMRLQSLDQPYSQADTENGGHREVRDPDPTPAEDLERQEQVEALHVCLLMLTEDEQLLVDFYMDERKPRDIVVLLGLPDDEKNRKKVSDALGYARDKLEKALKEKHPELYAHWRSYTRSRGSRNG